MLSQQLPTVNFQKTDETAHEKLYRLVQECLPQEEDAEDEDRDLNDDAKNTSFQVFTLSVCVSDCHNANKWEPLISMVLFTLIDAKHQRKKSQT